VVGFQGLNNLGVGRVSPNTGVSGFVFAASSDAFSLLIRALRTMNRIDILSRPQVTTTDNQAARVLVGQSFPYITGSVTSVAVTGIPSVTNTVNYRDVGVELQVTPKIFPDGMVVMRVIPQVSSVAGTTVQISTGVFATAFNVQTVETTVIAQDGETVAVGGLISKDDNKNENKVPWFGDLPGVGALFRYRTQVKHKKELLVILTPHIIRNPADADRILAMESRRMDWILGDVLKVHGTSGMAPIMPQPGERWPGAGPGPGGPGGCRDGSCGGNAPYTIPGPVPGVGPPAPDPGVALPAPAGPTVPSYPSGGPEVAPPPRPVLPPAPAGPAVPSYPSGGPELAPPPRPAGPSSAVGTPAPVAPAAYQAPAGAPLTPAQPGVPTGAVPVNVMSRPVVPSLPSR
jgi:hypothetical protein